MTKIVLGFGAYIAFLLTVLYLAWWWLPIVFGAMCLLAFLSGFIGGMNGRKKCG